MKKEKISQLDESWFWSKEWQKKEAEADEEIRKGKIYGPFASHEALMENLKRSEKLD